MSTRTMLVLFRVGPLARDCGTFALSRLYASRVRLHSSAVCSILVLGARGLVLGLLCSIVFLGEIVLGMR